MEGLVHIYTGDGKGKTTAAVGLGLRAWGRGKKVLMVQFLKGMESGELIAIDKLGEVYLGYEQEGTEGIGGSSETAAGICVEANEDRSMGHADSG